MMKRIIPVLLFTAVLLLILPATAQNSTYYTLRAARVRSCASTFCDLLGAIQGNRSVQVSRSLEGQKWNGSTSWFELTFEGQVGYIHSSLLTTLEPGRLFTPGAPSPAPIDIRPYLVGPSLIVTGAPFPTAIFGTPQPLTSVPPPASIYTCNGIDDLNCSDFTSQSAANAHLQQCSIDEDLLDADNNGTACEALPP